MDFLNHRGRGYGLLSGFPPFSFTEIVRGCVNLKKQKFQGKAVKTRRKILKNFVLISSKNSASGVSTSMGLWDATDLWPGIL
jgi:hypothetical protein